jgi:radical SAM protein with 4Fe4S-binding SPASM domain
MTPNDFLKHKSLCPLPWTGIYVNPDGNIKNCAISDEVLGNIHTTKLPDILNNDINQQIRKDMLENIQHKRCNVCYKTENNADNQEENESNRTWYKKVTIKNETNLELFDSTDKFQPTVIDLRWRNTCNQACVYCGPDLSSLWAKILDRPHEIDEDILAKSKEWIFSNLNSVKHVYLAGGEPLLIKENQILLEQLLKVSPDVEIRINSNLSNIDNPIFRLLTKFSNVKWTVSVDSKEQYFEYMRWPGNWNSFLNNLQVVKGLVGDQINFNMVWCILNDVDILDTMDYLLELGYHENMFIVQCLSGPSPLSILHLPKERRLELQERIGERQKKTNPDWWLYKSLSSMYNFLNQEINQPKNISFFKKQQLSAGLPGTFEYLQAIDLIQNVDSSKIFPNLYQYQ